MKITDGSEKIYCREYKHEIIECESSFIFRQGKLCLIDEERENRNIFG
jgi:hypothetical protein